MDNFRIFALKYLIGHSGLADSDSKGNVLTGNRLAARRGTGSTQLEPIIHLAESRTWAARSRAWARTVNCWAARVASLASMASLTPGMTTAA